MALLLPNDRRPEEEDSFLKTLKQAAGQALVGVPVGLLTDFAKGQFDVANTKDLDTYKRLEDAKEKQLRAQGRQLLSPGATMLTPEEIDVAFEEPGKNVDLSAIAREVGNAGSVLPQGGAQLPQLPGAPATVAPPRSAAPSMSLTGTPAAPAGTKTVLPNPLDSLKAPPGMVIKGVSASHSESGRPLGDVAVGAANDLRALASRAASDIRPAMKAADIAAYREAQGIANMPAIKLTGDPRKDAGIYDAYLDLQKGGDTAFRMAQSARAGLDNPLGQLNDLVRTGASASDRFSVQYGLPPRKGTGGQSFAQLTKIITDGEQALDILDRKIAGLSNASGGVPTEAEQKKLLDLQGERDRVVTNQEAARSALQTGRGKATYFSYPVSSAFGAKATEGTEATAPVREAAAAAAAARQEKANDLSAARANVQSWVDQLKSIPKPGQFATEDQLKAYEKKVRVIQGGLDDARRTLMTLENE